MPSYFVLYLILYICDFQKQNVMEMSYITSQNNNRPVTLQDGSSTPLLAPPGCSEPRARISDVTSHPVTEHPQEDAVLDDEDELEH